MTDDGRESHDLSSRRLAREISSSSKFPVSFTGKSQYRIRVDGFRRWRADNGDGKIDRPEWLDLEQIDLFLDCLFCVCDIYGVDVSRDILCHFVAVIYNARPFVTDIFVLNTVACDEWAKLGDLRKSSKKNLIQLVFNIELAQVYTPREKISKF